MREKLATSTQCVDMLTFLARCKGTQKNDWVFFFLFFLTSGTLFQISRPKLDCVGSELRYSSHTVSDTGDKSAAYRLSAVHFLFFFFFSTNHLNYSHRDNCIAAGL